MNEERPPQLFNLLQNTETGRLYPVDAASLSAEGKIKELAQAGEFEQHDQLYLKRWQKDMASSLDEKDGERVAEALGNIISNSALLRLPEWTWDLYDQADAGYENASPQSTKGRWWHPFGTFGKQCAATLDTILYSILLFPDRSCRHRRHGPAAGIMLLALRTTGASHPSTNRGRCRSYDRSGNDMDDC